MNKQSATTLLLLVALALGIVLVVKGVPIPPTPKVTSLPIRYRTIMNSSTMTLAYSFETTWVQTSTDLINWSDITLPCEVRVVIKKNKPEEFFRLKP